MNRFNPLDYPIALQKPLCLNLSAWTGHIPFAMTLIDVLRPRVFVELGTYYGTSYCAFCQAVDQLKLEAQGYAVDTWTGDNHTAAYGSDVLTVLRRHHDPLYSQFSTLLQMTFQEALDHFEDKTIDLLHIDGYHTYAASKSDFESWLPKLSDRAVVLFHDIHIRERDFGVWRLWEELKAVYPSFEFTHEHGLGVLAVGKDIPEKLRPLLECPEDEAEPIRAFYSAAGQLVRALSDAQELAKHPLAADAALPIPSLLLQRQYDQDIAQIADAVGQQVDWLLRNADRQVSSVDDVIADNGAFSQTAQPSRMSAVGRRAWELTQTSFHLLTKNGLRAFIVHLYRWLVLGERRFHRQPRNATLNRSMPEDHAYRAFVRLADPDADALNLQSARSQRWVHKPSLGIVTGLFGISSAEFQRTIESLLNQTYMSWTWYLVEAGSHPQVREEAIRLASLDARIVYLAADNPDDTVDPVAALNLGLEQADQTFIVRVDAGDVLAPHALYTAATVIRQHPTVSFIYSDMDYLDAAGRRCDPLFKPDWSPELLLSFDYLSGFSVYRRDLLRQIGMLDTALEDSYEWDLHFRIGEHTQAIHHIPEVLVHRRKQPSSQQSAAQVITQHLKRLGLSDPAVKFDAVHRQPIVTWKLPRQRKISIVIPSRDHPEIIRTCLRSIFDLTTYHNFEVIVVDTGSTDPVTAQLYNEYAKYPQFKLVHDLLDFNFGRACNLGVQSSDGELLLFLNNDTEVLQPDWLERMAQWYEVEGIGVVGPKLLFPDGRIQHAGVTIGGHGTGSNLFGRAEEHSTGMFGTDDWYRDLLAVSGACLMISRQVFTDVNGFDEAFILLYSDTHLCLSANRAGYRVVFTPHVRLTHFESHTRKDTAIPRLDFERASIVWRAELLRGDPYFNPNLSYRSAIPIFRDVANMPYLMNRDTMVRLPDMERFIYPADLL